MPSKGLTRTPPSRLISVPPRQPAGGVPPRKRVTEANRLGNRSPSRRRPAPPPSGVAGSATTWASPDSPAGRTTGSDNGQLQPACHAAPAELKVRAFLASVPAQRQGGLAKDATPAGGIARTRPGTTAPAARERRFVESMVPRWHRGFVRSSKPRPASARIALPLLIAATGRTTLRPSWCLRATHPPARPRGGPPRPHRLAGGAMTRERRKGAP